MYSVHDWSEVRRLHLREGLSKKHIAERLSMSRITVRRLLELEEPPRYERSRRPSKLDPFEPSIREMLTDDETVPATVVLERLREEGYGGGITILKERLARLRPEYALPPEPYQRTTYTPGRICQLDWWDVPARYPVGVGKGHARAAFGLVGVLPYSAAHAAVFTHSKTADDVALALPGVLERLGGLPRELVVDRDSSIVKPGSRRLHEPLAALLGHLAIRPVVLAPRKPTSKGVVERTNGYLESSFVPLRSFSALSDLQTQHDAWARDVAWQRHHRRVRTKPAIAHTTELASLAPLPEVWPDTSAKLFRRVSRDCFVRVAGCDYSVPPLFASRKVAVSLTLSDVTVFCEGRELVRHARSFVPADVVVAEGHDEELARAKQARAALAQGDVAVPTPDLSAYDALCQVRPS